MESKRIRSKVSLSALTVLIWGIVWGSIISVVMYYLSLFTDIRLFSYLDWILEWPKVLLPGFVIALIYSMCRRTTVTIGKEQIWIRRGLRQWNLPIESFDDAATSKKIVNHSLLVLYFVKHYLIFDDESGEKKYRIYDVADVQMEDIVRCIREQNMTALSIEEKVAIQDSLDKAEKGQPLHTRERCNIQNRVFNPESLHSCEKDNKRLVSILLTSLLLLVHAYNYICSEVSMIIDGKLELVCEVVKVTLDVNDRSTLITRTTCKVTQRTN